MITTRFPSVGLVAPRGSHVSLVSSLMTWLYSALLGLTLVGCSVMWVSDYDKEAVDRTNEISKSVLKFYQDLTATDASKRAAAIAGPLGKSQGDVESQIRLHLLREQARARNAESSKIATNLLGSWQTFSASHKTGTASALSDATLRVERGILERELRAAFIAEEGKKLGNGAATTAEK
ncbi:hypothetical protein J7E70_00765 [Variovorax paradoxus]|nr:hypothetical protein [Variovorax paradoxus]MBT2298983.1 hypothetical protein [Variovorax paradoxus]